MTDAAPRGQVSLWFLRAVEQPEGGFACHRGAERFDLHPDADAAVAHLLDIADELDGAIVFVHHLGGRVEEVARVNLHRRR